MACSIARTLDVIGEPWSPLILRAVWAGVCRFDHIQADLGISRKVLTERLNRLVEQGVLERVPPHRQGRADARRRRRPPPGPRVRPDDQRTVGVALGLGGAVFQAVSRDPMGSPDIIGFTQGSVAGALIVIVSSSCCSRGSSGAVAAGALGGGPASGPVIYPLAWRRGVHGYRLVLIAMRDGAVVRSWPRAPGAIVTAGLVEEVFRLPSNVIEDPESGPPRGARGAAQPHPGTAPGGRHPVASGV